MKRPAWRCSGCLGCGSALASCQYHSPSLSVVIRYHARGEERTACVNTTTDDRLCTHVFIRVRFLVRVYDGEGVTRNTTVSSLYGENILGRLYVCLSQIFFSLTSAPPINFIPEDRLVSDTTNLTTIISTAHPYQFFNPVQGLKQVS